MSADQPERRRLVPSRPLLIPRVTAILLTLGICGAWLGPVVLRDNINEDDAAQHIAWAQRAWGANPVAYDEVAR